MAKLGSLGRTKSISAMGKEKFRPNVVSIAGLKVTPTQKSKFHRQQAVNSLKANNFRAYRFHSLEVAKINSNLVIASMRKRKK